MRPDDDGPADDSENNFYLDQLRTAESTIETSRYDVCGSGSSPASAVASAVAGGGWVCDQADDWVSELTQRAGHIPTAFDDAADVVTGAMAAETERVPKDDPHGRAFLASWGYRSAMGLRD